MKSKQKQDIFLYYKKNRFFLLQTEIAQQIYAPFWAQIWETKIILVQL